MSHFAVHISTDGAAFVRDADEAELPLETSEVTRILRELADSIDADGGEQGIYRLRDVNGNRVGFATFNASDEELV